MNVKIIRHPTQEDWDRAKYLALNTAGKRMVSRASEAWKKSLLKCEPSPIRTLMFTIEMTLPYYSSVHFVRHKFGVEHYVTSQRNDRQDRYDRRKAPQDAEVVHIMDINVAELINMAHFRLCSQADETTWKMMQMIVDKVCEVCPEMKEVLVPRCEYLGRCPEMFSCRRYQENHERD